SHRVAAHPVAPPAHAAAWRWHRTRCLTGTPWLRRRVPAATRAPQLFFEEALPPFFEAFGVLAILAARSLLMPFLRSPSYCLSFFTLGPWSLAMTRSFAGSGSSATWTYPSPRTRNRSEPALPRLPGRDRRAGSSELTPQALSNKCLTAM